MLDNINIYYFCLLTHYSLQGPVYFSEHNAKSQSNIHPKLEMSYEFVIKLEHLNVGTYVRTMHISENGLGLSNKLCNSQISNLHNRRSTA